MNKFVFLIILSFVVCFSQWVETTIYLPDSLCGIEDLRALAHNVTNNRIYLTGWSYSDDSKLFRENLVIVIDANRDEKIAKIPTGGDYPFAVLWTPNSNKFYVANYGGANVRIYNGVTNNIITTIEVGGGPCAFTYNSINQKVYVANSFDNNVTVIDEISNQVIRTVPTGAAPSSLLWNATDNKIYAVNYDGNSVTIIDGVTDDVLRTLGVGFYPFTAIWNSTNNKVYVSNSGQGSNTVTIISGHSDSIIAIVHVGRGPREMVWNSLNNKIYVTNTNDSSITIINGQANDTIKTVFVGQEPRVIAWSALSNKIYIVNHRSGIYFDQMTIIDGFTDEIIKIFELGQELPAGPNLLWNQSNNKIYATTFDAGGKIKIINCNVDSIVKTIPVSCYTPNNVIWNPINNKTYVATEEGNVSVIDGENNLFISNIKISAAGRAMIFNLTNNKLYVESHNFISIINSELDSLNKQISVSGGLIWNSINNKIYVSNRPWFPQGVSVIDGVNDSIIKTLNNIITPLSLAFNSINNKIYVINGSGSNATTIIDGATDTIINIIPVDSFPWGILWVRNLNRTYISSRGGRNVLVIDGVTNSIITTINGVGEYPDVFAFNFINNKLYVLKSGGVTVIDVIMNVISNNITIEGNLTGLLWNSLNNKLFVLNASDSTVVVIDGTTDSILTRLPTGYNPVAIAWNSDYNRMYIANSYGKDITVLRDIYPGISENNTAITLDEDIHLCVLPNPFRKNITITFSGSLTKDILLKIYSATGKLIKKYLPSQENKIFWDGKDNYRKEVMPGVYFCVLMQGQKIITQKIIFTGR